jgi:hypothetical protein
MSRQNIILFIGRRYVTVTAINVDVLKRSLAYLAIVISTAMSVASAMMWVRSVRALDQWYGQIAGANFEGKTPGKAGGLGMPARLKYPPAA